MNANFWIGVVFFCVVSLAAYVAGFVRGWKCGHQDGFVEGQAAMLQMGPNADAHQGKIDNLRRG